MMLKRPALGLFFVLAFALPWAVWGTTVAQEHDALSWHVPASLAFWIGLPVAAYSAASVSGGWPAVLDLLRRLVRVRVPWRAWAAAALLTPALAGLVLLAAALFGDASATGEDLTAGALPVALALNLWLFLITEETAWRGFVLPRLHARMSPLSAALVLGVVWGVWHVPLFLMEDTFQTRIPFAGFMVSILATSVMVSWVFTRGRGSVLVAALFHAVTDVTIAYTGVMTSGGSTFWTFVGVQVAAAAVLALTMRRRLGTDDELVLRARDDAASTAAGAPDARMPA